MLSAAVVIGTLRVYVGPYKALFEMIFFFLIFLYVVGTH